MAVRPTLAKRFRAIDSIKVAEARPGGSLRMPINNQCANI